MDEPAAFRMLLTNVADHFDRAPRGAALETLQKFGVPSGTPFAFFLRYFKVIVASTVDKRRPLAPSPDMLMPTLFQGKLATQKKPYDSFAALWAAFANLKHNTSPAIDGDAFPPAPQGLSSLTHHVAASSISPVTSPHRNTRRIRREDVAHGVLNASLVHSRSDLFSVDYGLGP